MRLNLVLSIGTRHGVWLAFEWGPRTLCLGRYADLCLWGSDHMSDRFITGPPWPVSWGILETKST